MKQRAYIMAVGLLSLLSTSVWGQQHYLYVPQLVDSAEKERGTESVLVREVEIRRGDTLRGLSRKFSGHAGYYPQILLFNKISDPNRIYAGTTLKVPVSQAVAGTADESPKPTGRKPVRLKRSNEVRKNLTVDPKSASAMSPVQTPSGSSPVTARRLFDKALAAYRKDDCVSALELFDQYMSGNPESSLAAEVSLYKADCYLKLSVK
jgi:LysM repeat protein